MFFYAIAVCELYSSATSHLIELLLIRSLHSHQICASNKYVVSVLNEKRTPPPKKRSIHIFSYMCIVSKLCSSVYVCTHYTKAKQRPQKNAGKYFDTTNRTCVCLYVHTNGITVSDTVYTQWGKGFWSMVSVCVRACICVCKSNIQTYTHPCVCHWYCDAWSNLTRKIHV